MGIVEKHNSRLKQQALMLARKRREGPNVLVQIELFLGDGLENPARKIDNESMNYMKIIWVWINTY